MAAISLANILALVVLGLYSLDDTIANHKISPKNEHAVFPSTSTTNYVYDKAPF